MTSTEHPKILYSCFYVIGIFSLDSDQWFFENYSNHITELFLKFFSKNNILTPVLNISLQSFVNFFEKNTKNESIVKNQSFFLCYFFNIAKENRYIFVRENALKAISACIICLREGIFKDHLYYIIETLMIISSDVIVVENYENYKSSTLESISCCLESIFKLCYFDLFDEKRFYSLLKVLID
jgi:hypothetical protein